MKSYYNILGIKICLDSSIIEVHKSCSYILYEFICDSFLSDQVLIRVIQNEDKTFIVYKECQKVRIPSSDLFKRLSVIMYCHALNEIDKRDIITLHSGALNKNNHGVLIIGKSGNGKSTLTLELVANHDWNYLSDEVGLLDANHIIHPFLKTISCKQMGIVKLDKKWAIREFGCDYQIAVPKERHGNPVLLKAIFFVKYLPEKKPVLEPIKKSDSLVRLLNSQIGRAKSVATVEQMAEVVKGVNSYQLFHNNATEAASLITGLVEKL